MSRGERRRRATEALEQVGLRDRLVTVPRNFRWRTTASRSPDRSSVFRFFWPMNRPGNLDATTAETVLALLNQLNVRWPYDVSL
ncbi:MAG: hypothetical protein R3B96_17920 [Pirellulaceae bacterium]